VKSDTFFFAFYHPRANSKRERFFVPMPFFMSTELPDFDKTMNVSLSLTAPFLF
jgi:hypothetical protein